MIQDVPRLLELGAYQDLHLEDSLSLDRVTTLQVAKQVYRVNDEDIDGSGRFETRICAAWPYDMRPSVHAEKYIRDTGP